MQLPGSTVLVTGATGFTGSFVVGRLAEAGVEVLALVRRDVDVPGATTVRGDLLEPGSLSAAVDGADAVVHCAVAYRLGYAEAERLTVAGTRALAEAAMAAGCRRFVHISTISVYDFRHVDVVDEGTSLFGLDMADAFPYGVSKAEAERALAAVAAQGLPTVMLRPPAILGPHPRCGWTFDVARRVARGELTHAGDEREKLPYVFVENLADAVALALERDAAVGGCYNVIDDEVPWQRYLERLAAVVGRRLKADPDSRFDDESLRHFDGTLVRRELGYEPRLGFEEGMTRIEAFLADQDLTGEGGGAGRSA